VARLTSKRSAGSQRQLPDRKNGKVVEMQIGNHPVDPTKILTLCERRKTKNNALRGRDRTLFQVSVRPLLRSRCRCARRAAGTKIPAPSCTLAASNKKSAAAWRGCLLFHAPAANRKRRAGTATVKPIPVFLNSKEEIGWIAPLQNSNLWQEVV
jgi:hypothetical protein